MLVKSAVKIVQLLFQSDDLNLHSRSQLRLKLDKCLTCTIIVKILSNNIEANIMAFKLGMTVD